MPELLGSDIATKSLKTLEAGTGIEPVFTDLQSRRLASENKPVASQKYQDKLGALGERETPCFRPIGDFATAFLDRIESNARRQKAGNRLIDAALNCGADAVRFIEIIHAELSPGHPIPNPYRLLPEAREWARWADQLERDAYMLASFEASPQERQAAFLRHVGARVAA